MSKLKGEGLRKRFSPPITMGSLFDVAAVSFLLTKEWSKFASEAEDRDLIGVIMRWVHEIQSLLSLLKAHIHLHLHLHQHRYIARRGNVASFKNKITNKYVINQKHTVKSQRISQIK